MTHLNKCPIAPCISDFHHMYTLVFGVPCLRRNRFIYLKLLAMKKLMLLLMMPFFLPAFAQKWAKEYDFVNECICGLSVVKKAGKYGYVDKQGKLIVPLIYDEAVTLNEGYANVRKGEQWGYLDSLGNVLLEPQFNDAMGFSQGFAAVKKGGKWGFIDITGKMVITPAFENARSFKEGLAAVTNMKGFWGYIDKTGHLVIPHMYDFADNFEDGVARVMKGEKVKFINKHNVEVEQ